MPLRFAIASLFVALTCVSLSAAQKSPQDVDLAGGKLALTAPADWVRKQPAVRIIEHEFSVPAVKGDATDGRVTVMGAGGGVQANIDRWYGQFTQPDGGSTKQRSKVEKLTVDGQEVHVVDISGTFKDQRGPMAPVVERPKYRMLGAIIPTQNAGDYFIKFYGPEKTVTENEAAFLAMIKSLEQK